MALENLLTVKEVAAMLRVSAQTLYKMLEHREIPAVKIGSQWRFDRDKVRAWIESQGCRPQGEKPASALSRPPHHSGAATPETTSPQVV